MKKIYVSLSPEEKSELPRRQAESVVKRVFVGMSGGVDSSVSAYLLKKEGHDVTGVFIKVWQPDFLPCTWREDRLDAMRVAAKLKIPFVTLDLEKEYKKEVVDYLVSEYKVGRTPNPDVFCNKEVKFGAFLNWAIGQGADYVATGHYAQIETQNLQPTTYNLQRGKDEGKDQSYFLWTLTQEQLKHVLFPVGHLEKTGVRKIAKKARLITAEKKDSQGLCFVSNVDMKQFLKHFLPEREGNILNEKGKIIGKHRGVVFYTMGERHSFEISKKSPGDKPYYVVAKDISKNTLTVSHTYADKIFAKKEWGINNLSLVSPKSDFRFGKRPNFNSAISCIAQVRYHGKNYPCQIIKHSVFNNLAGDAIATVRFEKPVLISSGQSVVFYDGEVCLGGGIIF